MTIDITGPDGNVFVILGYAKQFNRQLKNECGEENDILTDVLKNFTSMKYEEILFKLEKSGLFEFTGRD